MEASNLKLKVSEVMDGQSLFVTVQLSKFLYFRVKLACWLFFLAGLSLGVDVDSIHIDIRPNLD